MMQCYSVTEEQILSSGTKWMDPKDAMLSEINQYRRCVLPYMQDLKKVDVVEVDSRIGGGDKDWGDVG